MNEHMTNLTDLAGIIICVGLSAFFSGAETTLTTISTTRANLLIERSPQKWGILKLWINARRRILAGLLIGNNLVNILCSILAYRLAYRLAPNFAEAISVFGLTLVILVFAEITPKGLAIHFAEKLAVPVLRVVWLLDKLFFVPATMLSKLPLLLFRGQLPDDGEPVPTDDEIKYHIRRGFDKEVFADSKQGELLMATIQFSATLVKEVMIPRTEMTALEEEDTLQQAIDTVLQSGHSRLPVYRDTPDHIEGILYAKDVLSCLQKHEYDDNIRVSQLKRKEIFYAPETQKISSLLTDMRRRSSHLAIVVDEFGGTAGIITMEDIIEELVGEIHDEYDVDEPEIRQVDENRWVVDGLMAISDFKEETGLELPDDGEYESVAGFAVSAFGRIPKRGKSKKIPGVQITVVDCDDRHIKLLEFRKLKKPPLAADEETDADRR